MIDLAEDAPSNPLLRLGAQPIALTAAALLLLIAGVTSIAIWRAYTGAAPETDRVVASRQLQTRTAQASEQLVEKTKGLEATQQESIDQLQVVQDQLQTMKTSDGRAAGRHQAPVRAGRDAERVHRQPAAVLCQRARHRGRDALGYPQETGASSRPCQRAQALARLTGLGCDL